MGCEKKHFMLILINMQTMAIHFHVSVIEKLTM
jgi:hypothetical protein